jgi:hypothetical protein
MEDILSLYFKYSPTREVNVFWHVLIWIGYIFLFWYVELVHKIFRQFSVTLYILSLSLSLSLYIYIYIYIHIYHNERLYSRRRVLFLCLLQLFASWIVFYYCTFKKTLHCSAMFGVAMNSKPRLTLCSIRQWEQNETRLEERTPTVESLPRGLITKECFLFRLIFFLIEW